MITIKLNTTYRYFAFLVIVISSFMVTSTALSAKTNKSPTEKLLLKAKIFKSKIIKSDEYKSSQVYFRKITNIYYKASFPFFIFANTFYILILFLGYLNSRTQYINSKASVNEKLQPLKSLDPISIIIPCYNEEKTACNSIDSMLRLSYPLYEIIVVNDGSKDKSLEVLINYFHLETTPSYSPKVLPCKPVINVYRSKKYSNLYVIDKGNGGKADALNCGINISKYPLICCVDSDSTIDPDGLSRVSMPFIEGQDNVIATGGTILTSQTVVLNDFEGSTKNVVDFTWFSMIQSMEYVRAFLVGRLGWDKLGCNAIISGAFGLFKKNAVIKAGGYAVKTIGEDMELLLRMQANYLSEGIPYKVHLLPDPVCRTEPPWNLKTLKNQRIRWSQGLTESLWLHKRLLFNPKAGKLGLIALPYLLIFELISAPLELLGYFIMIIGFGLSIYDPYRTLLFLSVTVVYGCILNLGAIIIDQVTFRKYSRTPDLVKLILGAILEHFGFRQFHLIWRVQGICRWILGKQQWGEMARKGVSK